MARQSNVSAAYNSLSRSPNGWGRLIASAAIATFLVVFLFSGGNGKANTDNLRSGQAHHVSDAVREPMITPPDVSDAVVREPMTTPPDTDYSLRPDETDESTVIREEEELQEAMDEATGDIKEAEEDQIEEEVLMLESATTGVANMVRIGMGRVFGSTLTNEEAEDIANQVESKLMEETITTLRSQSDLIAIREINSIKDLIEDEEEAGLTVDEIEEDVYESEVGATEGVRGGIDSIAVGLKSSLKSRAAEIEKEILEERLSAKLGKRVKLVIMDDEVAGVDDLLDGLHTLAPPAVDAYGRPLVSTATTAVRPPATQVDMYGRPLVSTAVLPPATQVDTYGRPLVSTTYNVPPTVAASPYGVAPIPRTESVLGEAPRTTTSYALPKPSYTTTTDDDDEGNGGW